MDIQGYVRDGSDFGKKKYWNPPEEVVNSIFCLKGTSEELLYIPSSFLESQKQKILIETKGQLGCEIFIRGKHRAIHPSRIVDTNDTIGAGDTFFAYFISEYIRKQNVQMSAVYATEETRKFLDARMHSPYRLE